MSDMNFPPLGSTVECALKIKYLAEIPMYEDLTYALLDLMIDDENEERIRNWMKRAGIEIINYDEARHKFKATNEIVLDVFWYSVNKIVKTEEAYKLAYFRNIFLNTVRNEYENLEQIKSYIDIVSKYSHNHLRVLKLLNGMMDYYYRAMNIQPTNTIPSTIAKSIELGVDELRGQYSKCIKIWNDLFELGLRKESSLHRWMTVNMFVYMSLVSDYGKEFLRYISKYG